ncbi:MAG: hypothetical protein ABFS05_02770 [Bacteroidota bacterium]
MKHFVRIFFVSLFIAGVFVKPLTAQLVISSVSTNPTGDDAAIVDLQSPDKGFLIPRFALDDATTAAPIASTPVPDGLMIYNEGGLEPDGFYFWDGAKWIEIINRNRIFANEQFGELYEIAPAGIPTTVALTTASQWYGWSTASSGTLSTGMTADLTNTFADKLAISQYGLYKIQLSMSIGGSQNQQVTSSIFVIDGTGSTETRIKVLSKISSAGDLISGSSIGVLELFPLDSLDLRFQSTNNGETLEIHSINFIVTKVGE